MAHDAANTLAYLCTSPYDVRLAQERFPKIHFHPLREHAGWPGQCLMAGGAADRLACNGVRGPGRSVHRHRRHLTTDGAITPDALDALGR